MLQDSYAYLVMRSLLAICGSMFYWIGVWTLLDIWLLPQYSGPLRECIYMLVGVILLYNTNLLFDAANVGSSFGQTSMTLFVTSSDPTQAQSSSPQWNAKTLFLQRTRQATPLSLCFIANVMVLFPYNAYVDSSVAYLRKTNLIPLRSIVATTAVIFFWVGSYNMLSSLLLWMGNNMPSPCPSSRASAASLLQAPAPSLYSALPVFSKETISSLFQLSSSNANITRKLSATQARAPIPAAAAEGLESDGVQCVSSLLLYAVVTFVAALLVFLVTDRFNREHLQPEAERLATQYTDEDDNKGLGDDEPRGPFTTTSCPTLRRWYHSPLCWRLSLWMRCVVGLLCPVAFWVGFAHFITILFKRSSLSSLSSVAAASRGPSTKDYLLILGGVVVLALTGTLVAFAGPIFKRPTLCRMATQPSGDVAEEKEEGVGSFSVINGSLYSPVCWLFRYMFRHCKRKKSIKNNMKKSEEKSGLLDDEVMASFHDDLGEIMPLPFPLAADTLPISKKASEEDGDFLSARLTSCGVIAELILSSCAFVCLWMGVEKLVKNGPFVTTAYYERELSSTPLSLSSTSLLFDPKATTSVPLVKGPVLLDRAAHQHTLPRQQHVLTALVATDGTLHHRMRRLGRSLLSSLSSASLDASRANVLVGIKSLEETLSDTLQRTTMRSEDTLVAKTAGIAVTALAQGLHHREQDGNTGAGGLSGGLMGQAIVAEDIASSSLVATGFSDDLFEQSPELTILSSFFFAGVGILLLLLIPCLDDWIVARFSDAANEARTQQFQTDDAFCSPKREAVAKTLHSDEPLGNPVLPSALRIDQKEEEEEEEDEEQNNWRSGGELKSTKDQQGNDFLEHDQFYASLIDEKIVSSEEQEEGSYKT